MSFRRSWLDQLGHSFFGTNRTRRGGFRQHSVEALEDRKYLSTTVTLLNDGHTLSIVGDRSDNHIAIEQSGAGVKVTADADPPLRFTGIDLIQVETGEGNDDVRVIYGFNPQPDPPGMPMRAAELRVRLGVGNDAFNVSGQLPAGAVRIGVDAGPGNDDVRVICGFNPQPDPPADPARAFDLYTQLGAGNDRFASEMSWPPDPRAASDQAFPPDPCRVAVMGDAGNDSINALIGLLNNAMPNGDVPSALSLALNGGEGNDSVMSTFHAVNLHGRTSIDLQGGNGNDVVRQAFDMVAINRGLGLNAVGGAGNDTVAVMTGMETRPDAAPSLFVNSPVRLNVEGGTGSDRLLGLIIPCVKPAASLDMVFSGGSGNDLVSILLGLEAGLLNPPSEHAPTTPAEGPVSLTVLGGEGDDQLFLSVRNFGQSASPLTLRLEGGPGRDTATVSSGIDASGWTN